MHRPPHAVNLTFFDAFRLWRHGQHRSTAIRAPRGSPTPARAAAEVSGCEPVHLPRTEIDRFEGRLEYWDSATETAWISEPTTPCHERPSHLVTRLAARVRRISLAALRRSLDPGG